MASTTTLHIDAWCHLHIDS